MTAEIVTRDPRFSYLSLPTVVPQRIHSGMIWTEGPVYFPLGDYFLWSDIPNNRIYQRAAGCGVRVWRENANNSNGNTRDLQGRLVSCEHLTP